MTAPQYAKLVAKLMADQSTEPPPPSPEARADAIAAATRALAARRRRTRTTRFVYGAVALAGLAASVAFVTHRLSHESPSLASHAPSTVAPVAAPSPLRLVDGTPLAKGSHIATRAEGGASIALATGTRLSLDESAQVDFEGDGDSQIFAIARGTVKAEVAKLKARERFIVRTADSEIEVRGTVFSVSHVAPQAECGGGTTTRVAVTEGLVVVRHGGKEHHVAAGDRWPRDCTPTPVVASTRVATRAGEQRPYNAPAAREVETPSQLAEQNDMFAKAVAARRAGKTTEAMAGFEELLRRFPRGPLAESASVERLRIARAADSARAAPLAREYLGRYPHGCARAEARAALEEKRP